jgi:16S rRNA (guanine527-N7)-methyltransferase
MNTARIAELLEPFLCDRTNSIARPNSKPNCRSNPDATPAHSDATPTHCHSEPAKAGEGSALLSPAQLESISTYIDILLRWNARINLTAIRDPEDIVTRHFGESLFAAAHLFPAPSSVPPVSSVVKALDSTIDVDRERKEASVPTNAVNENPLVVGGRSTLVDLGSGAGFPGLPIKLWAPTISLSLVESNHKKAAFLREITRALTLTDVNIQNARAEALAASTFGVVTLRAVERFESILPIAAALVAPTGRLALLIGASQQDRARASLPGYTWSEPIPVPSSLARILLIGRRHENRASHDPGKINSQ